MIDDIPQIRSNFEYLGAFPHKCTFKSETQVKSKSGAVITTATSDITGLTNISCLVRNATIKRQDTTSGKSPGKSSSLILSEKRVLIPIISSSIVVGSVISLESVLYRVNDVIISRNNLYTDLGVDKWQP